MGDRGENAHSKNTINILKHRINKMALEITKKERESSQNLIRRFSKRVKQSGLLMRARKRKYKQRPKSHQLKNRAALRREEKRKEYETMKKMGTLKKSFRRRR